MYWIKYKWMQLKQWFVYLVLYQGSWKKLWTAESDESSWEILHDRENEIVQLHYVPEDDYSNKDVKINMSYDEFEDLVKFILSVR